MTDRTDHVDDDLTSFEEHVTALALFVADAEDPHQASIQALVAAFMVCALETEPPDLALRRIARSFESAGWIPPTATEGLSTAAGIGHLAQLAGIDHLRSFL